MVFLKYNWPEIELAYVRGIEEENGKLTWLNKREIAEKFGVPVEYLRDVARRDSWKEKRAAFLLTLELKDGEIEIEDPKAELDNFNKKCYQAASNILRSVNRKINGLLKDDFDLSELIALAKLIEKIQIIGKSSFGDLPEDFNSAKSEFERLMKKLKEDEKESKNLPEPLPEIKVTVL